MMPTSARGRQSPEAGRGAGCHGGQCRCLVGEDRFRGPLANQGLQRGEVLVPGAGLAFACHDDADGVARQILEALNAERVAGCDRQRTGGRRSDEGPAPYSAQTGISTRGGLPALVGRSSALPSSTRYSKIGISADMPLTCSSPSGSSRLSPSESAFATSPDIAQAILWPLAASSIRAAILMVLP